MRAAVELRIGVRRGIHLLAGAAVLLTLGYGLSACGGSDDHSGVGKPDSHAGNVDVSKGDAGRSELPSSFPLAPGAHVLQSSHLGKTISVSVRLEDGPAAYSYWTRQLPAAGYQLTGRQPNPDGGLIYFKGNGWSRATLAVNADVAAIRMG